MIADMSRLFDPACVVIVGASPNKETISGQPLDLLRRGGYRGAIHLVNPKYDSIDGIACHPRIDSLPEVPDVALVAVAAVRVAAILEDCGRKGIPFVVVLSSGFAEMGPMGAELQAELSRIAGEFGIGLVGPNCQGVMGLPERFRLGFGVPFSLDYEVGNVSLVSQSGAFGNAILMLAAEQGVGFRHYVSSGNEVSLTSLDFIEQFIDDDGTKVIATYVEGYRDARRIVDIGRKAASLNKPIIAWKVGNSEAGARAAATHTANLAGSPALYRAAFKQAGIIQVNDVDELADCARAFNASNSPRGHRVGIVTLSGGAGIAMADRCSQLGLEVPRLPESIAERLKSVLPEFATAQNPLDLTAGIGGDITSIVEAIKLIASEPTIDIVGLAFAATSGKLAVRLAEAISEIAKNSDKPFLVAWNAPVASAAEAYEILERTRIQRYPTPGRCARAIAALVEFAEARRALQSLGSAFVGRAGGAGSLVGPVAGQTSDSGVLNEFDSKSLLSRHGLPTTRELIAASAEEAVRHAEALGMPVAMKILSPDIPHKSDTGGVRLNLATRDEVSTAFAEITAAANRRDPGASIDGVLVQEMVAGGTEVILGGVDSPVFGPIVMFGLGGVYAEIMEDVAFRIAPVSRADAEAMIREIRGFGILNGARGRPPLDIGALARAIIEMGDLICGANGTIVELDVNPLFVFPAGSGVKAADALVRLKKLSKPNEMRPDRAADTAGMEWERQWTA